MRRSPESMDVARERLARMVEAFAGGQSVDEIAQRTGLERLTVEAVIRSAMKRAAAQGTWLAQ